MNDNDKRDEERLLLQELCLRWQTVVNEVAATGLVIMKLAKLRGQSCDM